MNESSTQANDESAGFELVGNWLLGVNTAAAVSLICRRYDRIAPGQRLANSGRMIRPHRDQLLDSCHLATYKDDVKKLELGSVPGCRLKVAGVETKRRTE